MKSRVLSAMAMLLLAVPAMAQQPGTSRSLRGLGSLSFGTVDTSSVFGGGGGFRVTDWLQVTGEVGRFQDVTPNEIRDLADNAEGEGAQLGFDLTVDVKVPAWYVMGGGRYDILTGRKVAPFVGGGVGVARLKPKITAKAFGTDVTDDILTEGGAEFSEGKTEPLVTVEGGVGIPLTRALGLDFGYRYTRIFTQDPAADVNSVFAALRVGF